MSLILEALRKSEAERRRGATPSLYAEMPPVPTRAARFNLRWPIWIGLAALVPVAAWIAFGLVRPDPAPLVANQPVAEPTPALAPVRHLEARTVSPIIRPERPTVTEQAPVRNAPPDASPTPAVDEPQSAADLAARIAARAQAAARNDRDAVAAPAPASAMTSPERVLSLTDLSTDERKALPPLKMSMHLWNEDASRRFVIIDGDRLHEGDRIGNATVAAIVSDGVLLDWNGRQLKLPIR